jgi:hypothetical protein
MSGSGIFENGFSRVNSEFHGFLHKKRAESTPIISEVLLFLKKI